ncbi:NAD(P)H-dependent oxidoreductase [Fusibacter paucivorans]|uniref:NAD(P)H-dependent oxidoreductase n=1 Tax=Fusibacter paucivorans TaxID=76009 RepID=A0ABS5PMV7_9FIRM|nr:NAD(P)H-dependent oxidoreductase [Fusibacter paucivorans]MBS7525696.1 NAD(P)H-dependent oxidoreductase [Fusibacter paucivorans]
MGTIQYERFINDQTIPYHELLANYAAMANTVDDSGMVKRLFFVELDALGENTAVHERLCEAFQRNGERAFESSVCALVVYAQSIDYTKTFIKKFIYTVNRMGGSFIGHPAVEILPGLVNFKTRSTAENCTLEAACEGQLRRLTQRLGDYQMLQKKTLKLLALHAGQVDMSTTLRLWHAIRQQLTAQMGDRLIIDELHVDEGKIYDCYGCPYETCLYFAKEKRCFYGGIVVEDLFPALEAADVVLWVCPNYNDSISAKLMAVINRMTALYRNMSFYDKYLAAVIVSANSGNDAVAGQLIGALNVNKGFRLWPQFAFTLLANHPNDLAKYDDLSQRIESYVDIMHGNMYKNMTKT